MPWRIVFCGGAAIVIFDALAASAAKTFDFDYALAVFGPFLIYGVVGCLVSRTGGTLPAAAVAGAAVALVDATAGWAVSAAIGPGRIEDVGAAEIVGVQLGAVLVGALFGLVGGRLGTRRRGTTRT